MGSTWRQRLVTAANAPVDAAPLAGFRIVFGIVLGLGLVRLLTTGWLAEMYVTPRLAFTYPGFGWVRALPLPGMYGVYLAMALGALGMALGYYSRWCAAFVAVGFAYTQLIDITNYLNHNYLAMLLALLVAVLPAHGMWALRPEAGGLRVPAWTIWLVRLQVGLVYFFAGIAKAKVDWLGYGQPLQIWLTARTDTPLVGAFLDERWLALAMSWAGFCYDVTIAFWLAWGRTRRFAMLAVVMFHTATGYFFNIGLFPFLMTANVLVFFPAATWRRSVARLPWLGAASGAQPAAAPAPGEKAEVAPQGAGASTVPAALPRCWRAPRWAHGLLVGYVALQVLLPLRHFAYRGDVLWNEDGMRFAWHVMIREKHGSVTFVVGMANGKRLLVPPRQFFTARQEREMCGQPDLILQGARLVARELRARGYAVVSVHADNVVSLNGRAPVAMIDPTVDLLTVQDVGARDWVTPAPTSPPAQLRSR